MTVGAGLGVETGAAGAGGGDDFAGAATGVGLAFGNATGWACAFGVGFACALGVGVGLAVTGAGEAVGPPAVRCGELAELKLFQFTQPVIAAAATMRRGVLIFMMLDEGLLDDGLGIDDLLDDDFGLEERLAARTSGG